MWYIHTMEYYSAIRKDKLPLAATWTSLESIIVSEVSLTKTNITILLIHRKLKKKKKDTNELIYKTETDLENLQLQAGKGGREGQIGSLGLTCTHCYI